MVTAKLTTLVTFVYVRFESESCKVDQTAPSSRFCHATESNGKQLIR